MSGSNYTQTPNYGLYKPVPNADNDMWGDHWNTNADTLDALIKTVQNAAGVSSFNSRTGAVTLGSTDVTGALGYTPYNATNPSGYQTAAQVTAALGPYALSTSVPAASSTTPLMDGTAAVGTATTYARADHVHPTDTSRYAASNPSGYQTAAQVTAALAGYAPLASPALTGTPTVPTATAGTNTTQAASTAFVANAVSGVAGVTTWNTRSGAVTLQAADVSAVGGALLAGPIFSGVPQAPTAAAGTNTGQLASTAFVQAATAPALNDIGRNKLHNSMFNIAQRGAGPFATSGYTLDRWYLALSSDTGSVTQTAAVDTDRAAIGDESVAYTYRNAFTGNAAAGAYSFTQQGIEDVRRLAGKTVTVSFWAIVVSGGALKLGVSLDQGFGAGGSAAVTNAGQSVTLATTWARYSLTFTVPSMAGKTLGTDPGGTWINIWYSSGTTNATRSGSVGVQTGTVRLWGVQLEVGTAATPLEKPDPRYDLSNCQRFYCVMQCVTIGYGVAAASAAQTLTYPTSMRASPTLTPTGNANTNLGTPAITALGGTAVFLNAAVSATGGWTLNQSFTASADL